MLKKLIIFLTIFALISNIYSIYLHTKAYKNEYCMSKDIDENDTITISYLITGDSDEEKIDAKLHDPQGALIAERLNESGGEIKHIVKEHGVHKLCFYVPKPGENFISFEFFTAYEKGHTLDMAKDGKLYNFLKFLFFLNLFSFRKYS